MIYDVYGLPKDEGATDYLDSSRLAGIMTVFDWPIKVDCSKYLVNGKYRRHPFNGYLPSFSRDQAIPLIAGLYKQGHTYFVKTRYMTGKDLLTPSHMGHFKRCSGGKASWFQDIWLWLDVLFNCHVTPLDEQNQLLCMMMIADNKYLRYWVKHNKYWEQSITGYWSGWRKEPELAEHMILKIKEIVSEKL